MCHKIEKKFGMFYAKLNSWYIYSFVSRNNLFKKNNSYFPIKKKSYI